MAAKNNTALLETCLERLDTMNDSLIKVIDLVIDLRNDEVYRRMTMGEK